MNCLKCRVTLLAMEEGAGERETDVIRSSQSDNFKTCLNV